MSQLSDYAENEIVDHILGTGSWPQPPAIFVSLHTAAPDEDASPSNEVNATWYARKQPATGWNTASTSSPYNATNNGDITWDAVTGSSLTVTHVALWDASTAGNMLWWKAVTTSKLFVVGAAPKILDTELSIQANDNFSNYLKPKIVDHMLKNTAFNSPGTTYLAMYTTNPTAADTGTEVSGGGYARQSVTWNAASGGVADNNGKIDFGTASANLGSISHFGIRDASTSGNLLVFGTWNSAKTVDNGDLYDVQDQALSVTGL